MIEKEKKNQRKNIYFFQLLNDELFWFRYQNICLKPYTLNRLRECRTKYQIPGKKVFNNFIEDYKFLTNDTRSNIEIKKELLSIKEYIWKQ